MTDLQIPRGAVEAGARAMMRSAYAGDDSQWDKLQPTQQAIVRERAMDVLNAAAPLIVAAVYEQIAQDFTTEFEELPEDASVRRNHVALDLFDKAKQFRARAKDLRAQS